MKQFATKLVITALIAPGCIYGCNWLPLPPTPIPCCSPESTQKNLYLAVATRNETELKLVQDFNHVLAKKVGESTITVDSMKGQNIENLFSSDANRRTLRDISTNFTVTPSDDKALVQAFNRMLELSEKNRQHPFYAYIITSGTSNSATLAEIHTISVAFAKKKVPNVHFHIVGLSPVHRLEMSKATAPLDHCIKFSSASDNEWVQLLQPLSN
jgi:hypothetical protein